MELFVDLPWPVLRGVVAALHPQDKLNLLCTSKFCRDVVLESLTATIHWRSDQGPPATLPQKAGALHLHYHGADTAPLLRRLQALHASNMVTNLTLEGCLLDDQISTSSLRCLSSVTELNLVKCGISPPEAWHSLLLAFPNVQSLGIQQLSGLGAISASSAAQVLHTIQVELPRLTELKLCLKTCAWLIPCHCGDSAACRCSVELYSRLRIVSLSSGKHSDMMGMSNTIVAREARPCITELIRFPNLTHINLGNCKCSIDDDIAKLLFQQATGLTHLTVHSLHLTESYQDSPVQLNYLCLTPGHHLPVRVDSLTCLNLSHLHSPVLIKSKTQVNLLLPEFSCGASQKQKQVNLTRLLSTVRRCGGISCDAPMLELVCTCPHMATLALQMLCCHGWPRVTSLHVRYSHHGGHHGGKASYPDMAIVYQALAMHVGPHLHHLRITCRNVPSTAGAAALGRLTSLKSLTIIPACPPALNDLAHMMLICSSLATNSTPTPPALPQANQEHVDTASASSSEPAQSSQTAAEQPCPCPRASSSQAVEVKVLFPPCKHSSIAWWQGALSQHMNGLPRVSVHVRMLGTPLSSSSSSSSSSSPSSSSLSSSRDVVSDDQAKPSWSQSLAETWVGWRMWWLQLGTPTTPQ